MYLSILIFPLLGSISAGFLGRKIGVTGSHIITCLCLIISSILITIAFYEVGICGSPVTIYLFKWIDSEFMSISWEFLFDQLTVSLSLAVLYCSTLIHIYSVDYLSTDPHNQRFFSYLSLFTFFMLFLVSAGNYFVMFIGWEGIGIVSYLLINFYFTRIQSNKSAILALTMNRVGDFGVSVSFFALFAVFGSLNYSTIYSLTPFINETAITIIALLLLSGAAAKSSQLGLHSWLPGSMEAPTPVSALLHAATLVTAGIYLLLRSSPILEFSPTALLVITLIGATTAFFGASVGLVSNDLKRIIAMSTISQLGYMVLAIGLSQYNVALLHTLGHSFFKALLFLAAGGVIHSLADQQDIRKMGGLIKFLPFTYTIMLIGSLSLLATPWLTGFYSKDLILELAYGAYSFSGTYAYILGSLTAGITAFYSFRLISLVFLTVPNGPKSVYDNIHEAKLLVIIPLVILAIFSIFFGFIFADLFVGVGTDFFGNSLYISPNNISIVEAEFSLPLIIKLLPALLSLFGATIAIYFYNFNPQFIIEMTETKLGRKVYKFLNGKYFFDIIYNKYIITAGFNIGYNISKVLDRGVIELVGPYGLANMFNKTALSISTSDNRIISNYSTYLIFNALCLIFIVFAPMLINSSLLFEIRLFIIYIASAIFILYQNSISLSKSMSMSDSSTSISNIK